MAQDHPTVEFLDAEAWEAWLEENYATASGAWPRIAKKNPPHTTVRYPEVLDVALCFGWIDIQRRPLDEHFFLQGFTRRTARSKWSQVNREKAKRLIEQRRMRPAGLDAVTAAQADGRWEAAYPSQSRATVPANFERALDRNPPAKEFFSTAAQRPTNAHVISQRLLLAHCGSPTPACKSAASPQNAEPLRTLPLIDQSSSPMGMRQEECRRVRAPTPGYDGGVRDPRPASARPIVIGWLTSVEIRPASELGSCASPSWRRMVAWSKYTRSHAMRSSSKMKNAVMRQRNARPVGASDPRRPRCVPSKSNSTTTPSSM
jgi:uncharacterized protein YdeI (YjbR/CyaY-like superfamily)